MAETLTLFDKIWREHVVCVPSGQLPLLYIDLHLVHEVTSPQAFEGLRVAGRKVRQPQRTFAPLGYRPYPLDDRAIVPTYSPGFPMLLAVAKLLAGQDAMFCVVPLTALDHPVPS